jgi:hypothetical protein
MNEKYIIFQGIFLLFIIGYLIWNAVKKLKKSTSEEILDQNLDENLDQNIDPEENDKLVLISAISETEIKKILTDFCASYNQEKVQAHLRLTKIKADEFVISFPQNIDFEIYCYLINYLNYPAGFNKTFKPFGYTTTKRSDNWITEETANKYVMLYVSDHDTEYDNVSMTTSENIGYKLSFDHSHTSKNQLLDAPEKNYTPPSVSLNQLKLKEFSGFA